MPTEHDVRETWREPDRKRHGLGGGHYGAPGAGPAPSFEQAVRDRQIQIVHLRNAVLRQRMQQIAVARARSRTVALRRQIVRARASAVEQQQQPEPPPLDPSVKALIGKLDELSTLLPGVMGHGQDYEGSSPPPAQRAHREHTGHPSPRTVRGGAATAAAVPPLASAWPPENPHIDGLSSTVSGYDEHAALDESALEALDGSAGSLSVDGDDQSVDQAQPWQRFVEGAAEPDQAVGEAEFDQEKELENLDSVMESLVKSIDQDTLGDGPKGDKGGDAGKGAQGPSVGAGDDQEVAAMRRLQARAGITDWRRPRWRWLKEGVSDPDPEVVLSGKRLFRAATTIVIVFYVRPYIQVKTRKARSKASDAHDWSATLNLYFDSCRAWLLKSARIPVANSILKSPKLTLRLTTAAEQAAQAAQQAAQGGSSAGGGAASGAGGAGGGLLGTMVRVVARGLQGADAMSHTVVRVKVHARGVIQGVTKEMPPADILTFLGYLVSDGNYFPKGFFFKEEVRAMSFDELGAVRLLAAPIDEPVTLLGTIYSERRHRVGMFRVPAEGHNPAAETDLRRLMLQGHPQMHGKLQPVYRHDRTGQWYDTSLVEMLITNYLMVRIMVPWILLYPWQSGLVRAVSTSSSTVTHNCQVLASIVYLIMRVLRPELTPPLDSLIAKAKQDEATLSTEAGEPQQKSDAAKDAPKRNRRGGKDREGGAAKGEADGEGEGKSGDAGGTDDGNVGPASQETDNEGKPVGGGKKRRLSQGGLPNLRKREPKKAAAPLTLEEVMQEYKYVRDVQLIQGLLPDSYFLPVARYLSLWVIELAGEYDRWVQQVTVTVMDELQNRLQSYISRGSIPAGGKPAEANS